MDINHIIGGLNKAQRHAVTSDNQHLLVLAGAGSGKTRVLVHRIALILANREASPHGILAVTFTNKAAAEMRRRIETLLNINLHGVWVGTFHSLAHRLLRKHSQAAKLSENFQILDSEDQLRMIKRVHKELNLEESHYPAKESQWHINHHKDEGRKPKDLKHSEYDKKEQVLLQVYNAYEQACERGAVVDFAELLLRAVILLKENPSILEHYKQRFKHILVDEFQDTNNIQYEWIRLLTSNQNNITIVGDDDQSIYGWRGARIENILRFDTEFPGCETIRLEQNYRSTAAILEAANAVIANNQDRMGKELWTEGQKGEPIQVYSAFNEVEEARFVAERCLHWSVKNTNLKDIAILYRSNAQSRILEEALIRSQIPYKIYGGVRFFDRAEIKNALAYLRLVASRHDDSAFERIVNFPTRGIGEKTLDAIRQLARAQQFPMWQAAEILLREASLSGRAHNALAQFIQLINDLGHEIKSLNLTESMSAILQRSGIHQHYQKEKGDKGQARLENLKELIGATKEFAADEDISKDQVLAMFLDHVVLESGETQADSHTDAVQLMTLHASKGLEFPVVFMVGMEDGLFPSQRSMKEAGRLAEERRLCYVGITRAMQQLYLTHAESRRLYGEEHHANISRFVKEIPSEYIEEVRLGASVRRPLSVTQSSQKFSEEDNEFHMGQRVSHHHFGEGTVLDCEGSGVKARIQVNFDDHGSKWLIASMANLTDIAMS